jgi:hypothetical protein
MTLRRAPRHARGLLRAISPRSLLRPSGLEQVKGASTQSGWYAPERVEMARGLGFEPRLEVPKTPVLPLDDPRTICKVRVELPLWSFYCTHISMHYK